MKEQEIRPKDIFYEYLRLSESDAKICFPREKRYKIDCPACQSSNLRDEFEKNSFDYVSCISCNSLFLSPRPSEKSFDEFYKDSKSSKYWAENFFPATAESRRAKIFIPRVKRLNNLCTEMGFNPSIVLDIGAGYGICLEEWRKIASESRVIGVEPSKHLADICRKKDIEVIEEVAEDVEGFDGMVDLLVCFEVLEHIHSPIDFIKKLHKLIKPGGYILLSTLTIDGFDLQVLWDKSDSISPPHHINFFSIKGFNALLNRCGFKDINIFTPGVLDVDIVNNAILKNPEIIKNHRFLKKIINDDLLSESFQEYLSKNKLSSHAWIMAKK